MDTNDTKKVPKSSVFYTCGCCNYTTSRKSQFDRHNLTDKHKKWNNDNKNDTNDTHKVRESSIINKCECGKSYVHKQNLYRHKKTCNFTLLSIDDNQSCNSTNQLITSNDISKDLILKLVEENGEIKKLLFKQFETMQTQMQEQQKIMHNQISELIPRVGNNTINNKQKFNINIFLNEQCKDALTIEQFLNEIDVTLANLAVTKNKGLCEGVSNIFIENMNKLSLYERPMHCTDIKRETVYIKCNGENKGTNWLQDSKNTQLKEALKKVSQVQQKSLDKWTEEHPDWMENPALQQEYMKLVKNCTDDLQENKREEKVIKKVCNKVYLGDTITDA